MLAPMIIRDHSTIQLESLGRSVSGRGPKAAILFLGAGLVGGALGWSDLFDRESKAADPAPAMAAAERSASTSTDVIDLKQSLLALETELDRLETASRQLDEQATQLLGQPKDGQHRTVELPKEHAALIHYLEQCLKLVENVESSFGVLVAAEDQVDLKQRIPEAHKHVARIEKSGSAGMLVRRQVRVWIEKDLQAVESLNVDWPDIRSSVREFIRDSNRFETGDGPIEKIVASHQSVLKRAATRTRFPESRLGTLCRQTAEAAMQVHRSRQAQSAVAMSSELEK